MESMQGSMRVFEHELKIFFTIIQAIMISVVNDHIIRTVHDLSVHPDHKLFVVGFDNAVSITVVTSSSDIPNVSGDPVGIFIIDDYGSGTARYDSAIEKFFGFSVNFYEHGFGFFNFGIV